VSSVPAIQTAINNATSGDVIILANGTYLNNTLNIGKNYQCGRKWRCNCRRNFL
jgi:tRNA U34 5-carboxymethylaminomethyl modifying enzyme MnmG/GidA